MDLYLAGDSIGGDGTESIVLCGPRRDVYKRLVLKEDRIVGTVLYGDVADGPWYFDLIQREVLTMSTRQRPLFDRAPCEAEVA